MNRKLRKWSAKSTPEEGESLYPLSYLLASHNDGLLGGIMTSPVYDSSRKSKVNVSNPWLRVGGHAGIGALLGGAPSALTGKPELALGGAAGGALGGGLFGLYSHFVAKKRARELEEAVKNKKGIAVDSSGAAALVPDKTLWGNVGGGVGIGAGAGALLGTGLSSIDGDNPSWAAAGGGAIGGAVLGGLVGLLRYLTHQSEAGKLRNAALRLNPALARPIQKEASIKEQTSMNYRMSKWAAMVGPTVENEQASIAAAAVREHAAAKAKVGPTIENEQARIAAAAARQRAALNDLSKLPAFQLGLDPMRQRLAADVEKKRLAVDTFAQERAAAKAKAAQMVGPTIENAKAARQRAALYNLSKLPPFQLGLDAMMQRRAADLEKKRLAADPAAQAAIRAKRGREIQDLYAPTWQQRLGYFYDDNRTAVHGAGGALAGASIAGLSGGRRGRVGRMIAGGIIGGAAGVGGTWLYDYLKNRTSNKA